MLFIIIIIIIKFISDSEQYHVESNKIRLI